MQLIKIKCPECAATVEVGATATQVTCAYCGKQSQVQRRTTLLRRPLPLPPPPPGQQPLPVAVEQGKLGAGAWFALAAAVLSVATPCVVGPIMCHVEDAEKAEREARLRAPRWTGGGVVLRDLNGDGVQDVVGHMQRKGDPDEGLVTAVNGASGAYLWHCSLGAYRNGHERDPIGVVGNTMVRGHGASLLGLDLAKGAIAWRQTLAENIRHICAGPDGQTVRVMTADDKLQIVAVADGKLGPAAQGACEPIEGPDPEADRPDRLICKSHGACPELVVGDKIEGMASHLALHRPSRGVTIALGRKTPGTPVPIIARYGWPPVDEAAVAERMQRLPADWTVAQRWRARANAVWHLRGDARPAVLWKTPLPAANPLATSTAALDEERVDLTDEVVVAAYQETAGKRPWHLTAFAIADGRRLWDVNTGDGGPLRAVVATPTHALISMWTSLLAYDLKTGKPAFDVTRVWP